MGARRGQRRATAACGATMENPPLRLRLEDLDSARVAREESLRLRRGSTGRRSPPLAPRRRVGGSASKGSSRAPPTHSRPPSPLPLIRPQYLLRLPSHPNQQLLLQPNPMCLTPQDSPCRRSRRSSKLRVKRARRRGFCTATRSPWDIRLQATAEGAGTSESRPALGDAS